MKPGICDSCSPVAPIEGSNCSRPRIEPGKFAIQLELRVMSEGSPRQHTIPRIVCRDYHWIPRGVDEDGTPTGGFNDHVYFPLYPSGYNSPFLPHQRPSNIMSWILEHAICRIPPEDDDYDWSSPEEQWRAAIEEEQEGLGGGISSFYS